METERIEYIRKNSRKKGRKKGVLWCGIDPDNPDGVMVGFSICHSIDRFDYIGGQRVEGFGLQTAKERAEKWKFHQEFFIQNSHSEKEIDKSIEIGTPLIFVKNPDTTTIVELPPSLLGSLVYNKETKKDEYTGRFYSFLVRCKKYYKDKEFPAWCEEILKINPIDDSVLKDYEYEF